MRRVIIDVERGRRICVYPEGGMDLEAFVPGGIGWVLDNGAVIDDAELLPHLHDALKALSHVCSQLNGSIEAMVKTGKGGAQ